MLLKLIAASKVAEENFYHPINFIYLQRTFLLSPWNCN